MKSFGIAFSNPWLLLLVIPGLALVLFSHFRLSKRYRRTRNRVISVVLHVLVMTLCVTVLAGMTFPYELINDHNELILLVDVSDTQEETRENRDTLVRRLLTETSYDTFRVGVVTFGFDQVYAVPLTLDNDADKIYESYLAAEKPDTSATDIADAVRYAASLFEYPETSKIVIVTDGLETDEDAVSAVRSVVAQHGIKVDTAFVPDGYFDDGVQITDIALPESNVIRGESFAASISVYCKEDVPSATVELYDALTDEIFGSSVQALAAGSQTIEFELTFEEEGMHELCARVSGETGETNNLYVSFVNLTVHDKVLVLEQNAGDSDLLVELLRSEYRGEDCVRLINVLTSPDSLPKTAEELCAYDQVILNNIANADLPKDYADAVLSPYVYEYGGGLFTTGGSSGTEAHAYNRQDLANTTYQNMLPVQAVNYTPPLGVVIVIDISGSMDAQKRRWAQGGATDCVNQVLSDRDYVGIMTLNTTYGTELQLTANTSANHGRIIEAINNIGEGGGTSFAPAIRHAAQALRAEERVAKRHIVIVTDGMPSDVDAATALADSYPDITLSVIGIGLDETGSAADNMKNLVDAWDRNKDENGNVDASKRHLYRANNGSDISDKMRNAIRAPEITAYEPKAFYPVVQDRTSPIVRGIELGGIEGKLDSVIPVELGGYYGVRARSGADIVVVGEYDVPLYAQWKYGEGRVGSFMCDVYGAWSDKFMPSDAGRTFLLNVVKNLMPAGDIRTKSVSLSLREDNYTNRLSVSFTNKAANPENLRITGEVTYLAEDGSTTTVSLDSVTETKDGPVYVKVPFSETNMIGTVVCKGSGMYTFTVRVIDPEGNVVDMVQLYKAFSYSEEYDLLADGGEELLAELAQRGHGNQLTFEESNKVLDGFVTSIKKVFDPTITFIILAMVLFLLEIVVRKFKFKWPHELWREYRAKKEEAR